MGFGCGLRVLISLREGVRVLRPREDARNARLSGAGLSWTTESQSHKDGQSAQIDLITAVVPI